MTKAQGATADVFLTALKAPPRAERDAVLVQLAGDPALGRDILDLALMAQRRTDDRPPESEAEHS